MSVFVSSSGPLSRGWGGRSRGFARQLGWAAAGLAVALLGGCGSMRAPRPSTTTGLPPVATTPAEGGPVAAEPPPAPAPATGGLFGPGGLFGGPPDPARSPEAHANWQLEELASELGRDLQGTPVEVQLAEPGLLRVAVPAHYCFDAGRSSVKQPLAAVLDRMAAQLRTKTSLQAVLAGPADARDSNPLLATDRAAAARDYLIARGLPAARFAVVDRPAITGLEIRVSPRKGLRTGAEPARAPQ